MKGLEGYPNLVLHAKYEHCGSNGSQDIAWKVLHGP
jgi:hypothetical protein